MSNNLAIKLRSGTQQAHTEAENIGFMKCFVQGVIDRDCFIQLLRNLYFVYSELEAAIEKNKQHPVINVIYFPELNRQSSLEKDMEFYYGSQWHKRIIPTTAAQNYIARIQEISVHEPALLLGHSYTRYLGDLSGGQMLQKIAQSALKLSGYEGTSFYNFEQIPDKQAFKNKYRQALDAVPVDDTKADQIVAEANHAFYLNLEIIKELEKMLIVALGRATYNDLI
ncbi:heme oxygenase (biliverdin-producing) [Anabaena cylindrica FACHB-243]|uniref:heme oxygenase (biliverdin-producing) n=1 Tax=Anabaena cylindrica (strain ATCC 27899 / PCC 7122) TaxID=272123 RepID=K9Z9G4_ANACC|nr:MULTISPECIES: heme oxygenase (biliverdin-producing) [Anabaena]AFZ55838.1 Heme oxygenase [Anabaena cylindrica PCC 7122]MBD2421259.1 heme oxygenase (biliverdin-producing) [Anabaena cylindrica FACHB-243]MBY5284126.1 heme oxygenase (biliverdin-producing) [Anabaena sp. CCAP 1446/1C]MBY5308090.1 heme oxygenase (biliverdin-producing) [Anabaena sp. CCAP 1446/1C]MCM2406590.1 heme oxygenase (biliverdin-producing) [Anabaena sp. CCAP 1446/1C]